MREDWVWALIGMLVALSLPRAMAVLRLVRNATGYMRVARETWGSVHSRLVHVLAMRHSDTESNAFYSKYKDKLRAVLGCVEWTVTIEPVPLNNYIVVLTSYVCVCKQLNE